MELCGGGGGVIIVKERELDKKNSMPCIKCLTILLKIEKIVFEAEKVHSCFNFRSTRVSSFIQFKTRILLEMFYLNTIKQLFLFVEQLDQLEVDLIVDF